MSQANVNVVERIYEAFGRGDIPAVFEHFDPNIEWIAAENSPAAPGSPYHGSEAIREGVFARVVALSTALPSGLTSCWTRVTRS